jgi:hypothetical protein
LGYKISHVYTVTRTLCANDAPEHIRDVKIGIRTTLEVMLQQVQDRYRIKIWHWIRVEKDEHRSAPT